MKEHKPLTLADVGRVYVHGTSVRVVLINHLGDEPFQVTVKCMEPTSDGEYATAQVDSRNLAPTSQRIFPNAPDYVNGLPGFSGAVEPGPVLLILSPIQAALLHAMARESGWGYTEANVPEVAAHLLELANLIRTSRDASGTLAVKPPHADKLFDAQFEGASDRLMIIGVEE